MALTRREFTVATLAGLAATSGMTLAVRAQGKKTIAVGKPNFVTAEMVKPGATVIDVGINRVDAKLVGDVRFETVKEVAGAITPVPGGVGPLTIAMLLFNTVKAAKIQHKLGEE